MTLSHGTAEPEFALPAHSYLHTLKRAARGCQIFKADAIVPGNRARGFARYIVSGWSCCQRISVDGRRQIFAIMVPGDVVFDASPPMRQKSVHTVALTKLETIVVPVEMHNVIEDAQQKSVIALYDQLIRLGSMNAIARMAHLLLDLHRRLEKVGMTDGGEFPMPLKQSVIADLLGMTGVHVSRTMQLLRRRGLIKSQQGRVTILNAASLFSITHKSD